MNTNLNFGPSWTVLILPELENQPLYDSFIFKNASTTRVAMQRHAQNLESSGAP